MRQNSTPSEGGTGMVEGETQLQQALVEVQLLHTFRRWDGNAAKQHTFGRWNGHGGGRNAATAGSRGGSASAHLPKVGRKCGKTAHLRKVERAQYREKRSYSRLSWGLRFCAPSEGEAKMRKNSTPSEGETDNSFGRSLENARINYSFGRSDGGTAHFPKVGQIRWAG